MNGGVVHSLWAVALAVIATVCVAALGSGARGRRSARGRLVSLLGSQGRAEGETAGGGTSGSEGRVRKRTRRAVRGLDGRAAVAVGFAGLVLVWLAAGVTGCVAGAAAAWGAWRWRRKAEGAEREVRAEEVGRQLPLAADLLAACLAAGAGPREAAEAVGGSLGGPVGARLAQAAAEVRLGGDPGTAWGRLGSLPGAAPLAGCLARAQATGVPAVEPMARLAARLRAAQGRTAAMRARRAGVQATAPLGLCFLPAFLTVGVVPVVVGLAEGLMRGS
ncbi:type II secretion protein F [Streptomyces luteoverticillatus]|uniref:Type II secretion protein F n=1 Tax=Streptomyces luteoverticillatus TaxID=66425 RepID=A0A3S9PKA9_STRLT|nr:type II secretion system F family protein [Streptomyces luteoverticillatus]AZQ72747.1 type II secretion protein F [Streptomyces luteoverticillatus]